MTKQYKGRTATIEINEKNVIIKSSGFFSSSKKTIPLRDIKNVELSTSSVFSKDTVEIHYGSNVEKVRFSNSADAKKAAADITDIARKNRRTSPLGELTGLATSLFGIGTSVASAIKEDQERQRKREIQKAEAEYKKAVDDLLNSGKLTTTTYVNGREFNRPTAKDDIEAVFIAEYAKSPRTAEQPWSQKWTEQYGIQDVPAYLQSVVADGYLEEAVLGKALSTLTGEQLKTMLSDLSMKTSGAKSVLIQRLVEEADEHRVRQLFLNPVYALTEKGAELLRANQSVLADMWIDCEKAIEQGKNVAPEFKKPDTKKAKKKRTAKKQLTDAEKLREYKKSLKTLYEALKGPEIREQISTIKACKPTRKELEEDLRGICANACYSPIPYSETMGNIYRYRDFYSEEVIDQIYKGQTKYMLFDRTGFADLVHKISGDTPFDFFAFIDKKWDMFVSEYMRTH